MTEEKIESIISDINTKIESVKDFIPEIFIPEHFYIVGSSGKRKVHVILAAGR